MGTLVGTLVAETESKEASSACGGHLDEATLAPGHLRWLP